VFIDRRGLPVKPGRVSKRFRTFADLAKLDERLHFHSLRHTTGSWLAMQGVPLRVIQAILGHSTVTVTETYSHLMPETMQVAVQQVFGKRGPRLSNTGSGWLQIQGV
jgi:site-specific recombinase XerD